MSNRVYYVSFEVELPDHCNLSDDLVKELLSEQQPHIFLNNEECNVTGVTDVQSMEDMQELDKLRTRYAQQ
jgi:glutaredoxin